MISILYMFLKYQTKLTKKHLVSNLLISSYLVNLLTWKPNLSTHNNQIDKSNSPWLMWIAICCFLKCSCWLNFSHEKKIHVVHIIFVYINNDFFPLSKSVCLSVCFKLHRVNVDEALNNNNKKKLPTIELSCSVRRKWQQS